MTAVKLKWLLHVWDHDPEEVTRAKATKMLKANPGSRYSWVDGVCHVYLRPTFQTVICPPKAWP